MKEDKERCDHLAKGLPCSARETLGAWESFVYRVSMQIGYLMTEPERNTVWPAFASSFSLLVTTGKLGPLEAVDQFYDLSASFAEGRKR
jgi:hypothetical protein